MKTWKTLAIAVSAFTAVALTTATVFAFMHGTEYYTAYSTSTEAAGTYAAWPNVVAPYSGYFGGMIRGGPSCHGARAPLGYTTPSAYSAAFTSQLNISAALSVAEQYVASTGNSNLAVSQIEEYTLNFYVLVKEQDTGIGAFELLIDKYTGAVYPEAGLNMMWNTKYGIHNGMMSWLIRTPRATQTVTVEQAKANAQQYLKIYYLGTTVGEAQAFYGYYHIEVLSRGNTYGMLSVNAYTGQVWYHTWHGDFIQEIELS
jgi:hypothetical protein